MQPIIDVQNVYKSFRIYADKKHTLKERLIHIGDSKYSIHSVLKSVNLKVEKGNTIALIGENGSGKSTLLKLMSGIIYPDKGTIKMSGKVSSLLELGAGFHPDFSGRENIYNNASIFGLSRKQINDRYDQIVAFSELEEYIDNPVRTYSSGMYMRLAFSVAINVDADILLIDEILAVGDAHFQKKCMNMIKLLKRQGVTIILVTHDLGAAERICDYTVWLENGSIRASGSSREVVDMYLLYLDKKNSDHAEPKPTIAVQPSDKNLLKHNIDETSDSAFDSAKAQNVQEKNPDRWGTRSVEFKQVRMLDTNHQLTKFFISGDDVIIEMDYHVNSTEQNYVFGISITNMDGVICIGTNTQIRNKPLNSIGNDGTVCILLFALNLTEGDYNLNIACHSEEGVPFDYQRNVLKFSIHAATQDIGFLIPKQTWDVCISN